MTTEAGQQRQKRPLNVIIGIPDDHQCTVSAGTAGRRVTFALPGTVSVLPYLPKQVFASNVIYLNAEGPVGQINLVPGPILNHVADADRCGGSLKKIERIVEETGRACFNHPAATAKTTRDGVANALQGISNLRVPVTTRVVFDGEESIRQAMAAASLNYPVIVRIAGDHGGISTLKLDQDVDLAKIAKMNCFGKSLYISEFCDFASPDGRYRKYRIAVVGGEIFLRHMIVGDGWLLHAQRRGSQTETEEIQKLESFGSEWAPRLLPMFREMANRLDLDYFGVDCNVAHDGRVLLFEANPCMNILENTARSPNMWDEPIARIRRALVQQLIRPGQWRHPRKQQVVAAQ